LATNATLLEISELSERQSGKISRAGFVRLATSKFRIATIERPRYPTCKECTVLVRSAEVRSGFEVRSAMKRRFVCAQYAQMIRVVAT
jgi:hypothetical protein